MILIAVETPIVTPYLIGETTELTLSDWDPLALALEDSLALEKSDHLQLLEAEFRSQGSFCNRNYNENFTSLLFHKSYRQDKSINDTLTKRHFNKQHIIKRINKQATTLQQTIQYQNMLIKRHFNNNKIEQSDISTYQNDNLTT